MTNTVSACAYNFIRFPTDRMEIQETNMDSIQRRFYAISNFPNIKGCMGCTMYPFICLVALFE